MPTTVDSDGVDFTVTVTDEDGNTDNQTFTLVIDATNLLRITTDTLPNAVRGMPYLTAIGATGGKAPYRFSVLDGALPAGLALSTNVGQLVGTPVLACTPSRCWCLTPGCRMRFTPSICA